MQADFHINLTAEDRTVLNGPLGDAQRSPIYHKVDNKFRSIVLPRGTKVKLVYTFESYFQKMSLLTRKGMTKYPGLLFLIDAQTVLQRIHFLEHIRSLTFLYEQVELGKSRFNRPELV